MRVPRLTAETYRLLQDVFGLRKRLGKTAGAPDPRLPLIEAVAASGELAAIPSLLELLVDRSPDVSAAVADSIQRLMSQVRPRDLLALDEHVRVGDSWSYLGGWNGIRPADVSTLAGSGAARSSVLGLVSFHRSGHVREAAVRQLDLIDDGSELPFLLLRLNDWVANVQAFAEAAVRRRLVPGYLGHFVHSAFLVLRLQDQSRGNHRDMIGWMMTQLVRPEYETLLADLLRSDCREIARRSFRAVLEIEGEHQRRLVDSALDPTDVVNRFLAAQWIRQHGDREALGALLSRMQQDRYMSVRREVLLARVERQPETAVGHLERALMDRSAAMRELSRFYLAKFGQPAQPTRYRAALAERIEIAICLAGLGEIGEVCDLPLIVPFMRNGTVATRTAAVRAAGRIDAALVREDLLAGLSDPSKRVAQAAAEGLQRCLGEVEADALWGVLCSAPQHGRVAALSLLDKLGGWTAMPYLIRLAADADENLALRARGLIERQYNRLYMQPGQADRQKVLIALGEVRTNLPIDFLAVFEPWFRLRL
jgi:HEAT repeat protein